MVENADSVSTERQREVLITLTAMHYIEENMLLEGAQLSDAQASLKALFLRTSGAETMLRRLIEVLKIKRNMHRSFSDVSSTFVAVRRSIEAMEERADNLRRLIQRSPVSAEANAQFVGPFLSYSIRFLQRIGAFEKAIEKYLFAREKEVRAQASHRLAEESRKQLQQRFTGGNLGQTDGHLETRIKVELTRSLNYDETETNMRNAVREARSAEEGVQAQLDAIRAMSQAATEPARRSESVTVKPEDDMLARFAGLPAGDSAARLIDRPVQELLTLYGRAHGMFELDFDRLKQALQRLSRSSNAYFQAKEEDRDIATKREKLRKIEALIQFLERAAQLAVSQELDAYPKFSKALTEAISDRQSPWAFAAVNLLSAKVQAEAEMSTMG